VLPVPQVFGHARHAEEVVMKTIERDKKIKKIVLLIVVALYVIFPDFFPGPIDDAIVSGLGLFLASKA
jgi:uncharacterized membrane protein YkvA (DUF1232 family)